MQGSAGHRACKEEGGARIEGGLKGSRHRENSVLCLAIAGDGIVTENYVLRSVQSCPM